MAAKSSDFNMGFIFLVSPSPTPCPPPSPLPEMPFIVVLDGARAGRRLDESVGWLKGGSPERSGGKGDS